MTKPKRKLIFCWPYIEWGGAQVYFMATMKAARSDWDVVAVFPEESPPDVSRYLEKIGVRCETLDFRLRLEPASGIGAKLERHANRIQTEFRLLRYLKRYDLREAILHIETSPWQSWIFLTLLSLRGANTFVTMHNAIAGPSWRQLVWKLRMRFVTRLRGFNLFVSNQNTKDRIRDWARRSYWERIPVTYTCVDPVQIEKVQQAPIDRSGLRGKLGVADTDILVLCVGQFIDRKGRWVFLEAAKMLEAASPGIRFVWVAPQEPSPEDRRRIDSYSAKHFRLVRSGEIGSVREDVLAFFRIGDIFALPSYVEGLPIALLEAMALGLPAISTNVYAIPEAIRDEETGLLVEAGDAGGLAAAIRRLASDPELRGRLAARGSDFVLRNFDERAAAGVAIDAYNRCFANAPASSE